LNKALDFLDLHQDDRALKMLNSIPKEFPESPVRFKAYMELGKYHMEKREFPLAIKKFQQIETEEDPVVQAEALYQIGVCHFELGTYNQSFTMLRKVTSEYPGTKFANLAYFYIGRCHFKLKRWAKAVEALQKVGTSVDETEENELIKSEIGKKFYIKIEDKDLAILKEEGKNITVDVKTNSGDAETVTLKPGEGLKTYYIGEIETTLGGASPNDGVLQVIGLDEVTVSAIDSNTAEGERDRKVISKAKMVSSASVGFTDGAFRDYSAGIFAGSDCFVRVKDLDMDRSGDRDTVEVTITAYYKEKLTESEAATQLSTDKTHVTKVRDQVVVELTEDVVDMQAYEGDDENEAKQKDKARPEHSGMFTAVVPTVEVVDPEMVDTADQKLSVMEGDAYCVVTYLDEIHDKGEDPRELEHKAQLLIGEPEDVKITQREVNDPNVKAEKNLIEAKIFLKLGSIFKEVGLKREANDRAETGLGHVEDVLKVASDINLDRSVVEEAYSIKWDLLLVMGRIGSAIDVCNELLELFPDSALVDKALMKIAMAKLEIEPPDRDGAIRIYRSIVNMEESDQRAEAAYRIAETTEESIKAEHREKGRDEKPDLSRAIEEYKKVSETFPDSPYAGSALDRRITFYIKEKQYGRSLELIERVVQDYPDADFLDKIYLKWAIVSFRMGDPKKAIAKLDELLITFPNSDLAGQANKIKQRLEQATGS
jgi:tetratricopeptide (TPR) repeat protein